MAKKFQLAILKTQKARNFSRGARKLPRVKLAKVTTKPGIIYKALTATAGANNLLQKIPSLKGLYDLTVYGNLRCLREIRYQLWKSGGQRLDNSTAHLQSQRWPTQLPYQPGLRSIFFISLTVWKV